MQGIEAALLMYNHMLLKIVLIYDLAFQRHNPRLRNVDNYDGAN